MIIIDNDITEFLLNDAKNLKDRLVSLSLFPKPYCIHQKFDKFIKENMNLSDKVFNGKKNLNKYIGFKIKLILLVIIKLELFNDRPNENLLKNSKK